MPPRPHNDNNLSCAVPIAARRRGALVSRRLILSIDHILVAYNNSCDEVRSEARDASIQWLILNDGAGLSGYVPRTHVI